MVIYIDESGTNKQEGHSSMAVVYVEVVNREKFEKGFLDALQEIKIAEFHWADQGWKVRRKFFDKVFFLDFFFKVAVFKNPVHPEKMMENELKNVLRSKDITVKKLKTVRSESSYFGVQLADALAGLMRYLEDNPGAQDARQMVSKLQRSKKLFAKYISPTSSFK